MTSKDEPVDSAAAMASSVVLRGIDAQTFNQMESFVKDLESRPTERLLRDLPELAKLSVTKFSLVSYVILAKFRQADPGVKSQIRESIAATVETFVPGEQRERVLAILERLR